MSQELKINEVAKIANISIRTLHYYDQINLLKPLRINSSGYRIYDENSLKELKQILLLKEIGFNLDEIKHVINGKNWENKASFEIQKALLEKKRDRLNKLIRLVDDYIKGEKIMSFKEFSKREMNEIKEKYKEEVNEKWGESKAMQQFKDRKYSKEELTKVVNSTNQIFYSFSLINKTLPESKEAQNLVGKLKEHFNTYYYDCDNALLKQLGDMYINDERYKKNLDKYGEGTALFISKAINVYCGK